MNSVKRKISSDVEKDMISHTSDHLEIDVWIDLWNQTGKKVTAVGVRSMRFLEDAILND